MLNKTASRRDTQTRFFMDISMTEDGCSSWSGRFADLSAADQQAVAQLVKDGGAIQGSIADISSRLARSHRIELLRTVVSERIVGVAVLKAPARSYRSTKFAAAGVSLGGHAEAPELGYVVVADDMRGRRLSGRLVDAISKPLTEPCFATTDDPTMHKNLARAGFLRQGHEWAGNRGKLSLWIRPGGATSSRS